MAIAPETQYEPFVRPWALRHARERVGLSLDEAAKKISDYVTVPWEVVDGPKVTPKLISKWESGEVEPDFSERAAICRIYMYPHSGLGLEEPIEEPIKDFRSPPDGASANLSYETHLKLHEFGRYYKMAQELLARVGGAMEVTGIPAAGSKSVRALAREIRATLEVDEEVQRGWEDAKAAYEEWKSRIEQVGVFVITLPIDIEQVRGASRWDDGGPPAILVSTRDLPEARTFTLMHEFAHLAHRDDASAMCDPSKERSTNPTERKMNQIAAEVLVPEAWLRREVTTDLQHLPFRGWPNPDKGQLTATFGVSTQMMAIRLHELGLAQRSEYAKSGRGFGRRSKGNSMTTVQRYEGYLGDPLVEMMRASFDRGGVTAGEIVKKWLRINVDHIQKIIGDVPD